MDCDNRYLITIITISLFDYEALISTVNSVLPQMDEDVEYWIIDGGSGTPIQDYLLTLKKYGIKSISEKDDGIYDAMNKGLRLANGEWIVFINSGDYLLPEVIKKIKKYLMSDLDCIYCNTVVERYLEGEKYYKTYKAYADISRISRGMICSHQSFLVRTKILRDIQGFNQNYLVAADWDSIIRVFKCKPKIKYLDMNFSVCDMDGISSRPHSLERHEVRKKNKLYKIIDLWFLGDIFHDLLSLSSRKIFGDKLKKNISVKVKGFRKR